MSFEDFTPVPNYSTKSAPVRAGLTKRGQHPARLHLTFSEEIADRFDWKKDGGVQVQLGAGDDHGLVRIKASDGPSPLRLATRNVHSGGIRFELRLGHVSKFVDQAFVAEACDHHVESGWLVVALPYWSNQTAPKKSPDAHAATIKRDAVSKARLAVPARALR